MVTYTVLGRALGRRVMIAEKRRVTILAHGVWHPLLRVYGEWEHGLLWHWHLRWCWRDWARFALWKLDCQDARDCQDFLDLGWWLELDHVGNHNRRHRVNLINFNEISQWRKFWGLFVLGEFVDEELNHPKVWETCMKVLFEVVDHATDFFTNFDCVIDGVNDVENAFFWVVYLLFEQLKFLNGRIIFSKT